MDNFCFIAPPIPSQADLPWLVAKKFQFAEDQNRLNDM